MPEFLTISDELIGVASSAYDHYRQHGYEIEVESRLIGFPFTPAMTCVREHETRIIEVLPRSDRARVRRWAAYAKCQGTDTRITFVTDNAGAFSGNDLAELRENGIGLCVKVGDGIVEIVAAADLAVPVALPDLKHLPEALWPVFGPIYEKFNRGEWRDALDDACQAVEVRARAYLKEGVLAGRIVVLKDNGNVRSLSEATIDRMTLGALAIAFNNIQNRNHTDSVIANVLPVINPERVGLAHHRHMPETEEQLRRNAGNHMHAIIACLEELVPSDEPA